MSENKATRTLIGTVVSNKMDKTVTVLVERQVKHPIYRKYVRKSTKYHVHDGDNKCTEGDVVKISECKPISKTKSWQLHEIVGKAG